MSLPAIILLSGGLDSATTLAIARREGFLCHALSFDYGQRHRFELQAAGRVAAAMAIAEHRILRIDLRALGGSALTDQIDVPKDRSDDEVARGIPVTYVPARNTIFLSFAMAYAEVIDAADIFIGVNAVDFSGYPDCRPGFIEAFEHLARVGTRMGSEGRRIRVHAPLMEMGKGEIIRLGTQLDVDYGLTFSCYDPDEATGRPCGRCDSCRLRAAGFRAAGLADPASP